MKPFWKQTTAQGSAVFGHDSSYFEWRNNSFKMGRISRRWQFLDLDTSASNTTELDPYKFTHFLLEVVRSMGSFGFQIWLERRSSRVSVFYFRSRKLQFGASVDVGRENFSLQARGSTNQWYTRRYGAKEAYPRLGSLAARQTFFQAVDRLPHPRVRWLAS